MLPEIKYYKANTVEETVHILAQNKHAIRILAGGTDLLPELRSEKQNRKVIILDISSIKLLNKIEDEGHFIRIGALVKHSQMVESILLGRHAGFLTQASSLVGSAQIRNRGTLGGNICNAAPCADTLPPLVALDAELTLESSSGNRTELLSGFIRGAYKTNRANDEFLTWIRFKKLPEGCRSNFIKLGRREALSIARLQVAACGMIDSNNKICYIRIVPGSTTPNVFRFTEVEEYLLGNEPSERLFSKAGDMVARKMVEITGVRWSTEYKKPVIAALVRRSLQAIFNLKPGVAVK
ncbi:xanthine dehydrogenase family protein subunit M [bacterium]|nr:xanthine dehydrogenase family protein subunit M [bacterium]